MGSANGSPLTPDQICEALAAEEPAPWGDGAALDVEIDGRRLRIAVQDR